MHAEEFGLNSKGLVRELAQRDLTREQITRSAELAGNRLDEARRAFFMELSRYLAAEMRVDITNLRQTAAAYDTAHARWASWVQMSFKRYGAEEKKNIYHSFFMQVFREMKPSLKVRPVGDLALYLKRFS